MNYTRFVMDLDEAIENDNVNLWAKTVSKMFDIPRVTEELKTSSTTKATCGACKFLVNLLRFKLKAGASNQHILAFASQLCSILKIQSNSVCKGVMDLIGVSSCLRMIFI